MSHKSLILDRRNPGTLHCCGWTYVYMVLRNSQNIVLNIWKVMDRQACKRYLMVQHIFRFFPLFLHANISLSPFHKELYTIISYYIYIIHNVILLYARFLHMSIRKNSDKVFVCLTEWWHWCHRNSFIWYVIAPYVSNFAWARVLNISVAVTRL